MRSRRKDELIINYFWFFAIRSPQNTELYMIIHGVQVAYSQHCIFMVCSMDDPLEHIKTTSI